MKKKVILNSILVSTLMLSGAGVVNAAENAEKEYSSALEAQSYGQVEFVDTKEAEIVDPDNPDKPIIPGEPDKPEPTNPNMGDLVLQYVPNLDFGTHKKTSQGLEVNAKLIKAYEPDTSEKKELIPFVSTLDTRAERNGGWRLTVKRSDFITEKNAKIEGADVTFSNLTYKGENTNKPEAIGSKITIGTEATVIAKASENNQEGQGMGSHSLLLGNGTLDQKDYLKDDRYGENYKVTNGVTFALAKGAAVSADKYQSTFEWNLVPSLEDTNK